MMLCQTDRPPIKSHLRSLNVLAFHLLLTHFCRGQSRLTGPSQPIAAILGDDIILPCHLDPVMDAAGLTLEWTRPDLNPRFVHVWRDGLELVGKQHESFKGRTSLFVDELKHGNISLKLSKVKLSDEGTYRCFIPGVEKETFVQLVVSSDAVSSPVVILAGIDRDRGGVVLQCESKGWYPEPEVFWLDGEGNLLSAGPTETVRGPDGLYTVSSRVTVEKKHSNRFTCRVQQNNINQIRETEIHVPDDFFMFLSDSAVSIITGLAVSLAVCIVFILAIFSFVWRQNIIKMKRKNWDETEGGRHKNAEMQPLTAETERKLLKKTPTVSEKNKKHKCKQQLQEEQQRREEAENRVKSLEEELATKKKEFEDKQAEVQQLQEENQRMKNEKQELETKNKQLEENKAAQSYSVFDLKIISKQTLQDERQRREEAEKEVRTLKKKLENKIKEFEDKLAAVQQQLQDEKQRVTDLQTQKKELETRNTELEKSKWTYGTMSNFKKQKSRQKFKDGQQRMEGGKDSETLKDELQTQNEKLDVSDREATDAVNSQRESHEQDNTSSASQDSGRIIVNKVDPQGNFVRLSNMSNEDQQLMGWELHIRVNNIKPIIYRFESSIKLSPGNTVTIRASDCETNSTDIDLVWLNQKSWGTADQLLVTLFSDTGELEASNHKLREFQYSQEQDVTSVANQGSIRGHIFVEGVDLNGRYVHLSNMSKEDQQLEGWEIHLRVNNRKPTIYRFGYFKLKPGMTVKIWASDCRTNSTDTDLVWLNQKSWGTADRLLVTLFSNTGEEMAMRKVSNTKDANCSH